MLFVAKKISCHKKNENQIKRENRDTILISEKEKSPQIITWSREGNKHKANGLLLQHIMTGNLRLNWLLLSFSPHTRVLSDAEDENERNQCIFFLKCIFSRLRKKKKIRTKRWIPSRSWNRYAWRDGPAVCMSKAKMDAQVKGLASESSIFFAWLIFIFRPSNTHIGRGAEMFAGK